MDTIYTYQDFLEDRPSKLELPKRTGRRTTYRQWLEYQYRLFHDESLPAAGGSSQAAPAFVNHGRWLWECPGCLTAVQVSEAGGVVDLCCCPACFGQAFVQPVFPAERAEIEAELMRQPGYRWNAPFRNWEPGWSLAHLRARTAAAQAKLDAGATYVRRASIGTPRTWSVGEVLTAANMNTFVREIQKDLIGSNGTVELLDGLRPGPRTSSEIQAATDVPDGTLYYDTTTGQVVYRVGAAAFGTRFAMHDSGLLNVTDTNRQTITHTLGRRPQFYQLVVERVGDEESGWMPGDQLLPAVPASGSSLIIGVEDPTPTQYNLYYSGGSLAFAGKPPNNFTITATLANDPTHSDTRRHWALRVIAFG